MNTTRKDLREGGQIILAHGEVTGHMHKVTVCDQPGIDAPAPGMALAQYFEEPDGTRYLMALEPVMLRHHTHGDIRLDPAAAAEGAVVLARGLMPGETIPGQYRQGDVLLHPKGKGTWEVRRQTEKEPDGWRQVAD